jgi:hypothetical protein
MPSHYCNEVSPKNYIPKENLSPTPCFNLIPRESGDNVGNLCWCIFKACVGSFLPLSHHGYSSVQGYSSKCVSQQRMVSECFICFVQCFSSFSILTVCNLCALKG